MDDLLKEDQDNKELILTAEEYNAIKIYFEAGFPQAQFGTELIRALDEIIKEAVLLESEQGEDGKEK